MEVSRIWLSMLVAAMLVAVSPLAVVADEYEREVGNRNLEQVEMDLEEEEEEEEWEEEDQADEEWAARSPLDFILEEIVEGEDEEQVHQALDFFHENFPDLMEEADKPMRGERLERAVEFLVHQYEQYQEVKERAEEHDAPDILKEWAAYKKQDFKAIMLGRKIIDLKHAARRKGEEPDAEKINGIKDKLRKALDKLFDMRLERERREMRNLENELARLKETLEKKEKARDEIIQRRLKHLSGEPDILDW